MGKDHKSGIGWVNKIMKPTIQYSSVSSERENEKKYQTIKIGDKFCVLQLLYMYKIVWVKKSINQLPGLFNSTCNDIFLLS